MEDNLVIVESPAKAKTIEKFLGKDYLVKSSFGHVRDLSKKNLGIDIENGFEPQYEISPDKKKVVSELRKLAQKANTVWLASDEDREGEAIAWHLSEVLNLVPEHTKRIVFHEITKNAIVQAVKQPRGIDQNLVNAQQARRVLDRLVGFEISPVLWKKVKPSLSAGRVQSVAVRLLVEREREIMGFKPESAYRVNAIFVAKDKNGQLARLKAELNKRFKTKKQAEEFLKLCQQADFSIADIVTKPATKQPAPPFTTSTLQQEASRKLNFSVSQTMAVAQRLYEGGKITYMRTDSLNLSKLAMTTAKEQIVDNYGTQYHKARSYRTKSKGAQEAHEAIRPTYMNKQTVGGTRQEKRLYELIWKRAIASQMSDAKLEKTTVSIALSNSSEMFHAKGEVIIFDGFLKVYLESTDDEKESSNTKDTILPPLNKGEKVNYEQILATERFTHHPPRYTEASLVKKLEELGIGRPSTYAPTISTIQKRGYVVKEEREGTKRQYNLLALEEGKIKASKKTETTGAEKGKLFPTDIGMVVTDFLTEHFEKIFDYNFTASVEKEFDEIAAGTKQWNQMIEKFYKPFHKKVETTIEKSERKSGERHLGTDPKTGKPIFVRIGRYGPMAQIGESDPSGETEKPRFAALRRGQHLETITLEEALDLFKLPRTLGDYEDKTVVVGIGRFGPYVRHDGKFVSLKKGIDDPMTIKLDRAIELIEQKRQADRKKHIKSFDQEGIQILNGRWGPYISFQKKNYKIPKTIEKPEELSLEDCREIIKKQGDKKSKAKGKTKTKTTTKTSKSKGKTESKTKKTSPKSRTKKK